MTVIQGTPASGGYVLGKIRTVSRTADPGRELRNGFISETERLDHAVEEASRELDRLYESALKKVGENSADIEI